MNTTNASVKIQLYKGKTYSNGSHPVVLLYRINGKVKKRVLIQIAEKDWDSKNNRVKARVSNAAYLNSFLSEEIAKAERDVLQVKSGSLSAAKLFAPTDSITVDECLQREKLRTEKANMVATYTRYEILARQLNDFTPTRELDKKWMDRLVARLKDLGNSNNTIQLKIENLRCALHNQCGHPLPPEIEKYGVKRVKNVRRKLSPEEFQSLASLELPDGSAYAVARDMFVLSVYLRGIRIGDMLEARVGQFEKGRFIYNANKTSKVYDIKLIPEALAIVNKYANGKEPNDRLFPIFTWEYNKKVSKFENHKVWLKEKTNKTGNIAYSLRCIAKMLGIEKRISPHISRHTFAKMAIKKIGNPMITMELLGHSSLAVHQQYLEDIRQDDDMDKAADDIFSTE